MNELPRISIVTPSYNQGEYLAETLQSLVDQDYPNLEVVIQDGGSTDASIEIAERFVSNHPDLFQLTVESDEGQADALARGFRKTTGEIMGFLNSDDWLETGCLHSVARAIDPARGRHVVFGRSLFFGNDPGKEGRDHPARYTNHYQQLAIWNRQVNQIPQPSAFWHREVWERCGGINTTVSHAIDYDLFCRFSQRYRFHKVPEIWSHYRLHASSKTSNVNQWDIVDVCIEVSRRHWGPWYSPIRWRCFLSHAMYRRSQRPRAIEVARKAETALIKGSRTPAFFLGLHAAWSAPLLFRRRILFPIAATRGWGRIARHLREDSVAEICPNSWIGPYYETEAPTGPEDETLFLQIEIPDCFDPATYRSFLSIDGQPVASNQPTDTAIRTFEAKIPETRRNAIRVTLCANRYFVPSIEGESDDKRLLSARLLKLETRP